MKSPKITSVTSVVYLKQHINTVVTRTLSPGNNDYLENYALSLLHCIRRNVQHGMRVILVLVLRESIHFS